MAAIISRGPDTRRPGTRADARVAWTSAAAAAVLAAAAVAGPVGIAVPAAVATVLLVALAVPGRRADMTVEDLAELEAIVLGVRAELDDWTHAGIDRIDRVASIVADIRDQIR